MHGDADGVLYQYHPGGGVNLAAAVQRRLHLRDIHLADDRGVETVIRHENYKLKGRQNRS